MKMLFMKTILKKEEKIKKKINLEIKNILKFLIISFFNILYLFKFSYNNFY